jgi:hypothetical protein
LSQLKSFGILNLKKEIEKLKKQNEILKVAVDFYADEDNWENEHTVHDPEWRASQALKDIEEIK